MATADYTCALLLLYNYS